MTGNTKYRDNGGRMIFENATLCSQFLREYTGIELFKDIRPEDVEDMTERFLPMFSEERDSDVVKKITLPEMGELFVVALIEHKSSVDYNVVMQVFHYMSYIWEEYAKQKEGEQKGITRTKDFMYPPILPIVYYEDKAEWTAVTELKNRIFLSDVFGEYLPDYRYLLFRLQEQGDAELINRRDEISFIMLINRLRSAPEFRDIEFPDGYLDDISKAPGDVLMIFSRLIGAYLARINVPDEEIAGLTDQIKGGKMNMLFEHFEEYDVQATRKEARAEQLVELVCKKLKKGMPVSRIAAELEEEESRIRKIVEISEKYAPDYDVKSIVAELLPKSDPGTGEEKQSG